MPNKWRQAISLLVYEWEIASLKNLVTLKRAISHNNLYYQQPSKFYIDN